jgi:hypothetical protein
MIGKIVTKSIAISLTMVMMLELTACGTVFHPERKGNSSGSIDPIVAAGDAIGLLFFFIPGIIAFAVDFSNGTIYLPHGKHSSLTPAELKSVSPGGKVDKKALSELVSKKIGQPVTLNSAGLQVKAFSSEASLLAYLNKSGLTLASL